jgi:hypothetical protein
MTVIFVLVFRHWQNATYSSRRTRVRRRGRLRPQCPTGDPSTAKSPVALWDQERSGRGHRLADDHNRGKIDDVRFQLGDEYEEIFDCRGFRISCDMDEGLS